MKRALVTGATSGIGLQMAVWLHRHGWKLTLTGRNEQKLRAMAVTFGEGTDYIALNLAEPDAAKKLYDFCRSRYPNRQESVDFLVNNAGFGVFGDFTETSLEAELELLTVNIRSVHILMKLFLTDFVRYDHGYILNVASGAGFMAGPKLSSYYASKNYVVRLTTAVREELRRKHSHVQVSVLCPGPVSTNFNQRAGVKFSVPPATPQYVAEYGIVNALNGKGIIIPTCTMKLGVLGAKLCPEPLLNRIVYEIQNKKTR